MRATSVHILLSLINPFAEIESSGQVLKVDTRCHMSGAE